MFIRYYVVPGIKRNLLNGFKRPNADVSDTFYIDINKITKMVSAIRNVSEDQLKSETRKREVTYARQLCMYLSWLYARSSLKTIGEAFGRDHTTVIHARETIMNLMQCDPLVKREVEELQAMINK